MADSSEIDLYAAFPERQGDFPAVILLQETFGIPEHLRDVAEEFRKKGYAVVAPDLYGRITTRLSADQIIKPTILPRYAVFIKDGLAADIKASYNWLLQQDKVIKDKIGCAGFFSDGRVSFLAETVLPYLTAAAYFENGIGNFTGNASCLDGIMLFYGNEPEIQSTHSKVYDQVNALKRRYHKHVDEFITADDNNQSGNEHSGYSSLAAKEDWIMTLSFFEDCLK
ncbi:MAG TPA: dienelactone hydrolase family protein [Mucilaginibacter sp.]|nr:dienelactone hydrolase family protein [Mucilaginibacter sp.]